MIRYIIFLIIFSVLFPIFSRLRRRLVLIPAAIAAFCIALIPSGLFADQQMEMISNVTTAFQEADAQLPPGSGILVSVSIFLCFCALRSIKIIKQSNSAIVERLGQYKNVLTPGLNFIIPFFDRVVLTDSLREQTLDIETQIAVTKDSISVTVEAVIFWKIAYIEKTFYTIEDVEFAMEKLAASTLLSEVAEIKLRDLPSSKEDLNRAMFRELSKSVVPWGIEVNRVEVLDIIAPAKIQEAIEAEKTLEFQRTAEKFVSQSKHEEIANLIRTEAQATLYAIREIHSALPGDIDSSQILNYLLTQRVAETQKEIAMSENAKIVYMNLNAKDEKSESIYNKSFPASDVENSGEANGTSVNPKQDTHS